jgi:hypothetical protein
MYTNKEDEGEERRKMEWVGSCSERPGSLTSAGGSGEGGRGRTVKKTEESCGAPSGFVFVERTKTWTMMPPHIHETNQYLKSQTSCHTDHTHVLK